MTLMTKPPSDLLAQMAPPTMTVKTMVKRSYLMALRSHLEINHPLSICSTTLLPISHQPLWMLLTVSKAGRCWTGSCSIPRLLPTHHPISESTSNASTQISRTSLPSRFAYPLPASHYRQSHRPPTTHYHSEATLYSQAHLHNPPQRTSQRLLR